MWRRKITRTSVNNFRRYLIEEEKSRLTVEKYIRDVWKFYDFLPPGKNLDKEKVIAFKAELVTKYQVSSVNSMLTAVNRFLSFLKLDRFRVKQLRVQRQLYCPAGKELKKQEYRQLLGAAGKRKDQRLYMVIQTICATGIRVGELSYITVECLEKGTVTIHGKSKVRVIMLPHPLRKLLQAYASGRQIKTGSIFVTKTGRPLDRSNIWRSMKRIGMQCGLAKEKVFPHNLRHLFARTFYEQEKDVIKLADVLGHTNIDTTRIYTISTGLDQVERINRLGLVVPI